MGEEMIDHTKPISLSIALFLSSCGLVPSIGKDVKGQAAFDNLMATMNAQTDRMKKQTDRMKIDPWAPREFSGNIDLILFGEIQDCIVTVMEKHNRKFPFDKWDVALARHSRDSMYGAPKPNSERLEKANACADQGGIIQP